jgi:adiponectin receptor
MKQKSLRLFQTYPDLEEIKCPYRPNTKQANDFFKHKNFHRLVHEDNPYLFSGYRRFPVASLTRSLLSAFTLHNDTWNIWTHGLPAVFWAISAYKTDQLLRESIHASTLDRFAMLISTICCMCTMILSAVYHTFRMNTEPAYHFCLGCDLRGIVLLLAGGNIQPICLLLKGHEHWRNFYLILNLVGLVALILWIPRMVRLRLSNQRTIYFAVYSMLGAIVFLHRLLITSNDLPGPHVNTSQFKTMGQVHYQYGFYMIVVYLITAVGLVVRNLKAPERFWPYKFDIHGASHQIFHVICVIGNLVNFHTTINMLLQGAF